MASVQPKEYIGVAGLIDIVDTVQGRYELILCDHCKDGQHADCSGKKSKLHIAGYEVLGPCQCEDSAHNSLRKKGKVDEPNSGS